jgi:acyl CoA:acetate/3-ketoacid CoA transferase alpha subunit
MEESIKGDCAIVKAWKADSEGNLVFKGSSNNFNQDMATNAKHVIAEVEEIVEVSIQIIIEKFINFFILFKFLLVNF